MAKLRVLVVRAWTLDLTPITTALHDAQIAPDIVRVDFEAALHAAVAHDRFDVVVHDRATPGLSAATLDGALRDQPRSPPVVELEPVSTLGARVARAVAIARN